VSGQQLPAELEAAARREGFSAAEYNKIAMGAKVRTIQLIKLHLDSHPERLADEVDLKLDYGRSVLSCRFDEETSTAAAIFQFHVAAKKGRTRVFVCNADYAVLYAMPEDSRPEAATGFCKHVGSFAAYPYFRAVAAQMAWNAGFDLPPLPTIAALPVVPKPKPEQTSE